MEALVFRDVFLKKWHSWDRKDVVVILPHNKLPQIYYLKVVVSQESKYALAEYFAQGLASQNQGAGWDCDLIWGLGFPFRFSLQQDLFPCGWRLWSLFSAGCCVGTTVSTETLPSDPRCAPSPSYNIPSNRPTREHLSDTLPSFKGLTWLSQAHPWVFLSINTKSTH